LVLDTDTNAHGNFKLRFLRNPSSLNEEMRLIVDNPGLWTLGKGGVAKNIYSPSANNQNQKTPIKKQKTKIITKKEV
jgi:hypothetical protein